MTRDDLFVKHLVVVECDRWKDPALPIMARLAGAAHCHRRANGHSRFDPHVLREGLGMKHAADLSHLIERAVMEGVLAPGSCANCLILLGVTGGAGGSPRARCAVRHQHARVMVSHQAKLDGEQESRSQKQARMVKERREGEAVVTITMKTEVRDEEWAEFQEFRAAKRAEEEARVRREQMHAVKDGSEGRK